MATTPDLRPAIHAEGLGKMFRLHRSSSSSIKSTLLGLGTARYEEFWAVRDVSLTIARGSMMGIIGRNGSGKSTLLRMLCGVYQPTEGQVEVRGRITALLELGAGFHNELSGRENIFMNAAVMGIDRDVVKEVVDDIVALADIGDFIDSPVEVYSSGMRARLGFAVSVYLDPEILLADEIISVGDVGFAKHCAQHMQRMRSEGVTIALVAHNLGIMESMCDEVAWLHKGELKAVGDPTEVVREYRDFMMGTMADDPVEVDDTSSGITHLDATSEDGVAFGYTGAPLTVRAGYDLARPIEQAQVHLLVHHQDGPLHLGSSSDPADARTLEGRGDIEFHVPVLPVPPGRYSIELQLVDGSGDVVESRRSPLPVRPLGELVTDRFVDMNGHWRID
ncbi:MAG: ABC transporter ATP-binding protein [Acidimicrobiia bacterium]|nr:ABC transporter ATP-binding protein [Acidimicrobiia bacterium]MDH5238619.1 ABC transporter ATP-binding protein [Acidimicrobiia bacterium]